MSITIEHQRADRTVHWSVLRAGLLPIQGAFARLRHAWEIRIAARKLTEMSDQGLADIGIARSGIRHAVMHGRSEHAATDVDRSARF